MPDFKDYVSTETADSKVHVKVRLMDWLRDSGNGLDDSAVEAPDPRRPGRTIRTPSPRSVYYDVCNKVRDVIGVDEVSFDLPAGAPTPPAGGLPGDAPAPPSPVEVLKEIANAINNAENILNQENFVIASGNVQASVTVSLPGMAAAQATVQFSITPKPYS